MKVQPMDLPRGKKAALIAIFIAFIVLLVSNSGDFAEGPRTWALMLGGALLLGASCFYWTPSGWNSLPPMARVAVLLPTLLPLAQLIPLPPEIWQTLPGQGLRIEALKLVGAEGSLQPLSLSPVATLYTALVGVIFTSLAFLSYSLPRQQAEYLLRFMFGWIVVGMLVGFGQVATQGAAFKFYRFAHDGALIGFFANKNHMGSLIAASVPLSFYLLRNHRKLAYFYLFLCMPAVIATNSRAGFGLFVLSTIATLAVFGRLKRKYAIYVGVALLVATAVVLGSNQIGIFFDRFNEVGSDDRWAYLTDSIPILQTYASFGAGFGSFPNLFAISEPVSALSNTYLNHVHNDYVELIIEAGVPGILALLLFAFVIVKAAGMAWKQRQGDRRSIACAMVVGVFAAHSLMDYPLRRLSIVLLFAIVVGTLLRIHQPGEPSEN
jgi:O-antigen ligase